MTYGWLSEGQIRVWVNDVEPSDALREMYNREALRVNEPSHRVDLIVLDLNVDYSLLIFRLLLIFITNDYFALHIINLFKARLG